MQDAKEEVRARLAIEDVVGEYVQLKRAGRNFKGLSPFTSERTPSFVVSPEKQIWHDFSSGRGGDVFSFVMEVEGLDFRAALEMLARKAGIDLAQFDTKQSGELAARRKRAHEANELAARYYQQSLLRNTHALNYVFKQRTLDKKTVQEFRIGYAPAEGGLVAILEKRGFSKAELTDAGLTNRFGGDLFRGRMMVSLMDSSGQVIGFTGRILSDEPNAPKYLNTPQTVIYDKSRHVFGLHLAKEAIRRADKSVLVEGNMDVVSAHQAGTKQVVATAGTALTEWQLKALSRLSGNVALAFDGDKAGLAATERAIPIAAQTGVELTIVSLPDDVKDPDELIQRSVDEWRMAIDQAEPVVDWVIAQYEKREDMDSAAGKRRFSSAATTVIRALSDPVEAEHYMRIVADKVGTSLDAIEKKLESQAVEKKELKPIVATSAGDVETYNSHEDVLLSLLITKPATRSLLNGVPLDIFKGEGRRALIQHLQKHPEDTLESLPKDLQEFESHVKIVELKAETRYDGWSEQDVLLESARLLRQIEIEHKKQKTQQLVDELRIAEEEGDDARAALLRAELSKLIKETARA